MTAQFNDAEHPRDRTGKFTTTARPEAAGVELEAPSADTPLELAMRPDEELLEMARVRVTAALGSPDTALGLGVRSDTEAVVVTVDGREALAIAAGHHLPAVLSDAITTYERAAGAQAPYRADDPLWKTTRDATFGPLPENDQGRAASIARNPPAKRGYEDTIATLQAHFEAGPPTAQGLEDAVAEVYATTQTNWHREYENPECEHGYYHAAAIALGQVYARGDEKTHSIASHIDSGLRWSEDFATVKEDIVEISGEHREGWIPYQRMARALEAAVRADTADQNSKSQL